MAKPNQYLSIISLFEKFLSESKKGKRLQKNGSIIKPSTIRHYKSTLANLKIFEARSQRQWVFNIRYKNTKANFLKEKTHYKKFYDAFTSYFYDKGCIDNYVALNIKNLRAFFSYLTNTKGYQVGDFYKDFYARREEIPVIVLNLEQLKFIINDKEFESSLPPNLKKVKDIFVVGCSVGLRYCDLMNLSQLNIEKIENIVYLVNKSQKTNTYTRIKLPEYALKILDLYKGKQKTLLPGICLDNFNTLLKKIGELAGWTRETGKIRSRKGLQKEQRNSDGKLKRFCDLLSSHVMRKTAITTMLMLGMPEALVRKASGHAANSKEFYRYVNYSDSFMDNETDKVFAKLTV